MSVQQFESIVLRERLKFQALYGGVSNLLLIYACGHQHMQSVGRGKHQGAERWLQQLDMFDVFKDQERSPTLFEHRSHSGGGQVGVLLLKLIECQSQIGCQTGHDDSQIGQPGSIDQISPAGIIIGEGLRIEKCEGGFADAANSLHGGDGRDLSLQQLCAQPGQFGMTANESVAGSRNSVPGFSGAAGSRQSFAKLLIETSQSLPDFALSQRSNSMRSPLSDIEVQSTLQVQPLHQIGLPLIRTHCRRTVEGWHRDNVDGNDRYSRQLSVGFVVSIELPFLSAVRAAEILFRHHRQHQLRGEHALQVSVLPVI